MKTAAARELAVDHAQRRNTRACEQAFDAVVGFELGAACLRLALVAGTATRLAYAKLRMRFIQPLVALEPAVESYGIVQAGEIPPAAVSQQIVKTSLAEVE